MESHGRKWEGVIPPKKKSVVIRKIKSDYIGMEITVGAHYAWTQMF